MWRDREYFRKRIISSLLAALLVLTPAFSSMGSITVFAAEHEEENISKAGMAYKYAGKEDVQISVLAENESFAAGEEVHLRVFILNNTQETLRGGNLKFTASGIENGRFTDQITDETQELLPDENETVETAESDEDAKLDGIEEGTAENQNSEGLQEDSTGDVKPEGIEGLSLTGEAEPEESIEELTEESLEDTDDEDDDVEITSDGRRIRNIVLEPGEIFEAEFFGMIDPDLEKTVNRTIRFSFQGENDRGSVSGRTEFAYNTGVATMLPVEFDNDGELLTNEENTMYLRTVLNDDELAGLFSGPSFGDGDDLIVIPGTEEPTATSSNASKATDSNASKATSSNAEKADQSNDKKEEESSKAETAESTDADMWVTAGQESEETTESGVSAAEDTQTTEAEESAAETGAETAEEETSPIEEAVYSVMMLESGADETVDYIFETEAAESEQETSDFESSGTAEQTEEETEDTSAGETEEAGDSTKTDAGIEESLESTSGETMETTEAGSAEAVETTASDPAQVTDPAETETEEEEEIPEDEEFDIRNIRYEITTYGVRLRGASVDTHMVRSSNAELVTAVGFRVADKTAPGLYFGTAATLIEYKKKTYKTSTGFWFYVTGEGEVILTGSVDGAKIEVRGPAESFPDSEELELLVSEVPEDKAEMVAAALQKKAAAEGITVDKMKAVDIKIVADGEEKELEGEVTVTFQQVKLERLDGLEDEEETHDAGESAIEKNPDETETAERTQQEQTGEGEAIPGKARRAAARGGVYADDERIAAASEEVLEDADAEAGENIWAEENKESSEGTVDGKKERNLAVWHLDEEAGELSDMGGDMDENGDVVMTTNHFSIFIVVDMGQLGGNITLTVEHWGTVKTIDGNGTDATQLIYDGRTNDSGETIGYYTKDEVFDRKEIEIRKIEVEGKIYETDRIIVPNKMEYDPIEELSKICRVMPDERKNYAITKILVSSKVEENVDKETKDWTDADEYVVETDAGGNITKVTKGGEEVESIKLQTDSVIRFVYEERVISALQYRPVTFYDYNISADEGKGGTNANSNFSNYDPISRPNKIGAGQTSSGNKNEWAESDSAGSAKTEDGLYLNQGNYYKKGESFQYLDSEGQYGSVDSLKLDLSLPRIIPNIVQETLDDNYNLRYGSGIADPDFFLQTGDNKEGTVQYNNYKLGFEQNGDTYRLSAVKRDETIVLTGLTNIICTGNNWRKNSAIYSNNFWPLDNEDGIDEKGKSDEADGGGMHNFHFGMRFDFNFRVGDYVGPMNFYFRGDDDFWMFVDGKRVIDLGGIHSAQGRAVDLKQWLKDDGDGQLDKDKVHRVSIFYMERGGFGSCCYMQFTLPNCEPIKSPSNPQTTVTVKKEWDDYNNPERPKSIDVTLYQKLDDVEIDYETKTLSDANNWQYTWTELPTTWPNNSSKQCTYIVKEESLEGYNGRIVKADGNNKNGWVITVKNTLSPEVKVKVTKEWVDHNNACGNRRQKLKFQLYADGEIYPSKEGVLEIDGSDQAGNTWVGTFEHLPKYRYVIEDGKRVAKEIQYTVRETDNESVIEANEDGSGKSMLSGNHIGENYKVFYEDTQPLTDDEMEDNYVAHTKVTNIHKHRLEAEKIWDDQTNALPYISLYEVNQDETIVRIENTVRLMEKKDNKIIAVFEELDPAKTYTVRELQEILSKDGQPPADTEYDFAEGGKYFRAVDEGGLYQNTYEVSYNGPHNKGNNTFPCIQVVTIQNSLRRARLRVAKWITNWNDESLDYNDLLEDEFIVQVNRQIPADENVPEALKKPFETGVVLNHAGTKEGAADPAKFSGYIEVLVKEEGDTFNVSEIIPKEYGKVGIRYIANYTGEPISASGDMISEADTITVHPGDDGLIIVYNQFDHQDYFHHDASADNDFAQGLTAESIKSSGEQTGRSTSRSGGGTLPLEPEPVNMLSLLPGELLIVEREEEEELDEDDRLV